MISIMCASFTQCSLVEISAEIPSATDDDNLSRYSIYTIFGSMYIGRQIAVFTAIKSQVKLFFISCVFIVLYAGIIVYVKTELFLNDIFILVYIGLVCATSSWILSNSYQTSSLAVSREYSEQRIASNTMNIFLYISIFLCLIFSYFINILPDLMK